MSTFEQNIGQNQVKLMTKKIQFIKSKCLIIKGR